MCTSNHGGGVTQYEYQNAARLIPQIWCRDQVKYWELASSVPLGYLDELLNIF